VSAEHSHADAGEPDGKPCPPDRESSQLSPANELDILILGPVPPPLGGIAVHIDRLVPLLQKTGLRVGVLNHFSAKEKPFVVGALNRNPFNYFRLTRKFPARVVHYHHSQWLALVAVALASRRGKSRYIVTLHGAALVSRLKSGPAVLTYITRWALRRFDAVIVVNPHILSALQGHVEPRRVDVLPAYLEASEDEHPYDETLESFLSTGTTLLTPVYGVQFLDDGRDLYGLDNVVEAFAAVAPDRPELRLAFFVANRPSRRKAREYLLDLERRVERSGLGDRMMVVFGTSLTPAFRHDVILVRSTRSEGDALSIREALAADVPVVASDVVARPGGTSTFRTNDVNDLCRTILATLDRPTIVREPPQDGTGNGGGEQLLERLLHIYRSQLRSTSEGTPT
jgi:glycosyltransferase involved in cell wall biosynthesis